MRSQSGWPHFRAVLLALTLSADSAIQPATTHAQTAPGEIAGHKIRVPGEKMEGTTAKLSEVESELVAAMAPQEQAERLLQYAISHHVGATDYIKARVSAWRGLIRFTTALDTLLDVARNGDDLRFRAAALEIELAALNIAKASAAADALLRSEER